MPIPSIPVELLGSLDLTQHVPLDGEAQSLQLPHLPQEPHQLLTEVAADVAGDGIIAHQPAGLPGRHISQLGLNSVLQVLGSDCIE